MNLEEVDELLTKLAEEYNIPKPRHCVYQYKLVKPLEPIITKLGAAIVTRPSRPFISGTHIPLGKIGYMTLTCGRGGTISRRTAFHEFYHYKAHIERDFKPNVNPEEEEKKARSFAKRKMKEYRDNKIETCLDCGRQVRHADATRLYAGLIREPNGKPTKGFFCKDCFAVLKKNVRKGMRKAGLGHLVIKAEGEEE